MTAATAFGVLALSDQVWYCGAHGWIAPAYAGPCPRLSGVAGLAQR